MDAINTRLGRGTIKYAASGIQRPWKMRQQRLSPRYTTQWDALPMAKAICMMEA